MDINEKKVILEKYKGGLIKMIKMYEKKPVGYYAYLVFSKRIKDRLGKAKKDVRIYPIYDENLEVIGIQVTTMINRDNKWIDSMIQQTIHLVSEAT